MTSLLTLVVVFVVVAALWHLVPYYCRLCYAAWMDNRAAKRRPERVSFIAELPIGLDGSEEAMVKVWNALGLLLKREPLVLNYDAANEDGHVVVCVVVECDETIERRVKDTIRRCYDQQASFVRYANDPYEDFHARLLRQDDGETQPA
jgi:hypothetical protein